MKHLTYVFAAVALLLTAALHGSLAQTNSALQAKQMREDVDTTRFKKPAPYKVGVSAGYLSNSWVVFCLAHIRYEASRHPEISEVVVTDAAFNPGKQVADIEDLISKNVSVLLYWPVDDKAIEPVLKKAADRNIATIDVGGGFVYSPGTTSSAFIDQLALGEMVAKHLAADLNGKGKIFAMLPIAGTTAAVDQLAALQDVLRSYPQITLLSAEHGDWNRAKAKQITENLLQRYPRIDGVFSPAGQMSIGVAEAFEEAGRLDEVKMSPGDEYNGWLKWVARHHQGGAVTFPTRAGQVGMQVALEILKGHTVKRGNQVPSEYISPADVGRYVEPNAPDDWWASTLPDEWKPK